MAEEKRTLQCAEPISR